MRYWRITQTHISALEMLFVNGNVPDCLVNGICIFGKRFYSSSTLCRIEKLHVLWNAKSPHIFTSLRTVFIAFCHSAWTCKRVLVKVSNRVSTKLIVRTIGAHYGISFCAQSPLQSISNSDAINCKCGLFIQTHWASSAHFGWVGG